MWWVGTWPFGHIVATPDYVELSMFPGLRDRLSRAELDAIEYQWGRGLRPTGLWLVAKSGRRSTLWFGVPRLDLLLEQLSALRWPVRPGSM